MALIKRPVRAVLVAGMGLAAGLGLAVAAAPGAAHASSTASSTASSNTATIALPGQPGAAEVDQATNVAYVASAIYGPTGPTSGVVYAINVATGELIATIPVAYLLYPTSMAINQGTGTLYVGSSQDSRVAVIDTSANDLAATISLPTGDKTESLAFDPGTGKLFMGLAFNAAKADIAVVDPATDSVTATITSFGSTSVSALAADPAQHTLYTAIDVGGTSRIYAISTDTYAITKSFPGADADPMGMAIDTAHEALYVDYLGVEEARYSLSSGQLTGSHTFLPESLGFVFDPATGFSYTVDIANFTILQLNSALTAVTGEILRGDFGPMDLDVATNTLVYAAWGNGLTTDVHLIRFTATGSVTSHAAATFTTGKPGTFTVKATGTPHPFFSETGKLPAGVKFLKTGVLSGTPARGTGGAYRIRFTASNGLGSATQAFTLTVDQPTAITSANHATFTPGRHGSFTIRTSGYPAATVAKSNPLPSGLHLTPGQNGTATISGTPANSARGKIYIIRLTATNGVGATATQRFTLTVS